MHKQAKAGERYSVIFRTIKTFAPVDAAVANMVNSGQAPEPVRKRKAAEL